MLILTAYDLAVIPGHRDLFETLRTQMLRDIQPVNSLQVEFFNQALRNAWTIRRCDAAERDLGAETGVDPLFAKGNTIDRVHRVRRQSERAYRQAIAELTKLQTDRAIRQLKDNKGLDALPVPIDTKAYITAAREAGGFTKKQRITFPPVQAAFDRVARELNLGANSWEAWQKTQTPQPTTTPPPHASIAHAAPAQPASAHPSIAHASNAPTL